MLGLAGLIKLRKTAAAAQLLEKYGIEVGSEAGFYLKWVKGQQFFERANSTKTATDYTRAAEMLAAALDAPTADRDINATAQCRSQLASCYYHLGQHEQAARLFEQAADGLRASGDEQAAKTAWNAFLTYQALARKERRFLASASDVLRQIKRDHPASSYAKLADYHIGKLQQENLSPEQLLERWEKVEPGASTYLAARFDICSIYYRLWTSRSGAAKEEAAKRLVDSAERYLSAARRRAPPDRQLRICLFVVSMALGSEPRDEEVARRSFSPACATVRGCRRERRDCDGVSFLVTATGERQQQRLLRQRAVDLGQSYGNKVRTSCVEFVD